MLTMHSILFVHYSLRCELLVQVWFISVYHMHYHLTPVCAFTTISCIC